MRPNVVTTTRRAPMGSKAGFCIQNVTESSLHFSAGDGRISVKKGPMKMKQGFCLQCGHHDEKMASEPIMIRGASSSHWKGTMQFCGKCGAPWGVQIHAMATNSRAVPEWIRFWREELSDPVEIIESKTVV